MTTVDTNITQVFITITVCCVNTLADTIAGEVTDRRRKGCVSHVERCQHQQEVTTQDEQSQWNWDEMDLSTPIPPHIALSSHNSHGRRLAMVRETQRTAIRLLSARGSNTDPSMEDCEGNRLAMTPSI